MSTDAFPFGPADDETDLEQADAAAPADGRGRGRALAAGLVAVLVAAAGFVLLDPLGGSEQEVAAAAPAAADELTAPVDPADASATDGTPADEALGGDLPADDLLAEDPLLEDPLLDGTVQAGDLVPSTFADVTGRNPFDLPAYLNAEAGGATSGDGLGVVLGAGELPELPEDVDADPGTAPTGPGGGSPTDPDGGQPGATVDDDGRRIALVDVYVDDTGATKVQTRVDGTVHTTVSGEVFATTLQVVSVDGTCAQYLNGDERFTLCEGQEVLK